MAQPPGRVKVLVVDDDAPTRGFIHRVLQTEFNADVTETDDGLGALECLHSEAFDLIIVDLNMQVIDGIETLQAIRRTPALRTLPVIAISGAADESRTKQLVALNVADIVAKPITLNTVRQRLAPVMIRARERNLPSTVRGKLNLRASSRLLLVGPPDPFQRFLTQHLACVCDVAAFGSAASALREAIGRPPDAVFITGDDFLLPPALLARKLRAPGQALPKVYLCEPSAAPFSDDVRCFDGRLNKVATSLQLFRELRPLLTNSGLALALLPPHSPLLHTVLMAAADTLHKLIGAAPVMLEAPPRWSGDDHRAIEAVVEVSVDDVRWHLELLMSHSSALRYASDLLSDSDADLVGESAILSSTRSFAENLATQLRNELLSYDITAAIGASDAWSVIGRGRFEKTVENSRVGWFAAAGPRDLIGAVRVVSRRER